MKFLVTLIFIGCLCAPTYCFPSREKIFVLHDPDYEDNRTLVVVSWTEDGVSECEIFTDKSITEEVSKDHLIRRPSREEMQSLLEECIQFSRRRRRRDVEEDNYDYDYYEEIEPLAGATATESSTPASADGWNVIFPGTKWCGAGDVSKHDDDLGFHQDTDRCCRAHDKCDDLMLGGESKNNLTNKSPFTKLNCQCDDDFYDCLDRINSVTSNTIGNTYFNVLKRTCYTLDYPKTKKCKKYRSFLKLKCAEYEIDKKAPKVWQWRSAKKYKKIPFPGPLTFTLPF